MTKLVWGLLVVAATVVVSLYSADLPGNFWTDRQTLFLAGVIVLAVSACRPIVLEFLGERGVARERRALNALKAAYIQIVDGTGLDYREVGLHAFLVKRDRLRPWRMHLARVARWRIRSTPAVTGVTWLKGKGLIGRCWELRQNVGADLASEWSLGALTRDQWEALPAEMKYGFSYDEYLRVRDYGAIIAVPILDERGRFVGCVSADAPGEAFDLLWEASVLESLHDAGLWILSATDR